MWNEKVKISVAAPSASRYCGRCSQSCDQRLLATVSENQASFGQKSHCLREDILLFIDCLFFLNVLRPVRIDSITCEELSKCFNFPRSLY